MKIYISGISGTGMGPLALMAHDAGLKVFGSDLAAGAVTNELVQNGISLTLGSQDGGFLRSCVEKDGVTWFVHTAALPPNHPELKMAKNGEILGGFDDDGNNVGAAVAVATH